MEESQEAEKKAAEAAEKARKKREKAQVDGLKESEEEAKKAEQEAEEKAEMARKAAEKAKALNLQPTWIDLVIGQSYIPNYPSGSRAPDYYLAALNSKGDVYLKGSIEPFATMIPENAKKIEDYVDYGVRTSFVQTIFSKPILSLSPAYGSVFATLKDKSLIYMPSMDLIDGKWLLASGNKHFAYLISEDGDLFQYDLKAKITKKITLEGSVSKKYKFVDAQSVLFINDQGELFEADHSQALDKNIMKAKNIGQGLKYNSAVKRNESYFGIGTNGMLYTWGYKITLGL